MTWIAYGKFETYALPDLVRRLGPTCYLCGTAKTEHAEHLVPKASGGSALWGNLGGACRSCNRAKGTKIITLTQEQQSRWERQQSVYRAAWARLSPDLVGAQLLANTVASMTIKDVDPVGWLPDLDDLSLQLEDDLAYLYDVGPLDLSVSHTHITITFEAGGALNIAHAEFAQAR